RYRTLGLMSGSSLDGLDLALCHLEVAEGKVVHWELHQAGTLPFSEQWQKRLAALPAATAFELACAHADFGRYMGKLVQAFFSKNTLRAKDIDLIASHGHTIFHEPTSGFTTQIGDGAVLAAATGCTVVSDFRSADMALGGQGAPIAPMADKALFPGYDFYLNIGGIANITCDAGGKYIAFDITGANQLLNALAREIGLPFDKDGALAATGQTDPAFLKKLNSLPYFERPYPKSLSNQWVQKNLVSLCLEGAGSIPGKLRTVCEHIAMQTAGAMTAILEKEDFRKESHRIFATGGGALNTFLVECIREKCSGNGRFDLVLPEAKIIQFKEACLMALLGVLRMEEVPNCMAPVTGASKDAIGGAIYSAQ
ncbi:MAG: anhydro-N-acetylmuramic acid kinase, partial [Saprospiraceae bacterium]